MHAQVTTSFKVAAAGVHAAEVVGAVVSMVTVLVPVPVEFVFPKVSFAVALM